MKNFNIALVWLGVLLVVMATSCTEPFPMNTKTTYTRLVIYGEISTDTTVHRVYLSKSADYFSNKPVEKISGALVTITDGTVITQLQESSTEAGTYETGANFYGVPGHTYKLLVEQVDLLGNGSYVSDSASSYLPNPIPIDSVQVAKEDFYTEGWAVKLFAQDPEEEGNCYAFKAYINGKLDTDTLSNITTTDDKLFNGKQTNGIIVFFYEELNKVEDTDTVTLEMMTINRNYMNFLLSVQTAVQGSNPLFSGPPANISTNFKNGAMGFFTAFSLSRKSTIVRTANPPQR